MAVQWYPGHMHKAQKAISEAMPQVDLLIEVLDARFPFVDNGRNLGAMAAFELVEDKQSRKPRADMAAAITAKAKEKGLILLSCGMHGNTIRFLMPVTIEDELLEEGLAIVESALQYLA